MKNSFKQVSIRLNDELPLMSDKSLSDPVSIINELASQIFTKLDKEELCVINFNADMKPINFYIASVGTLKHSLMHPREMLKSSILSNADKVVVLHNHPAGSLYPSEDDINSTRKIVTAFNLLDISVLDHIIIGANNPNEYYSFREDCVIDFDELNIYENGLINFNNLGDTLVRNIDVVHLSEELVLWQNTNSLTLALENDEAELLLDYEDMKGYSLAVENDRLVKINNNDDDKPLVTFCDLEEEIYNLCDYIKEQIVVVGGKRDNPYNFNEFCYATEEFDKLQCMDETARSLFSKTTLGKSLELGFVENNEAKKTRR